MVTVEQVPAWITSGGIAHAVYEYVHGTYCTTACNWWIWGEPGRGITPKRVCRACRRRLKTMSLKPREATNA